MIYFDNSATTFPKPECVYENVIECIKTYCGNPGRSSHALSARCDEEIYLAREAAAGLLNVKKAEEVVFTQNATYALNLAIKTTVPRGSHVIISDIEHNSVIRPLFSMSKNFGVEYSVFDGSRDIRKEITSLMRKNTVAVICNLLSNVNGKEADMKTISDICKENSLIFIADASQKIGHIDINLKQTPCDILCAPGHKSLFGIQGAGFAVFGDGVTRESYIEGGSGSDSKNPEMPEFLPERYEAGTLPTPSIVALRSGIEFIKSVGISNIKNHIDCLTQTLSDILDSCKAVSFLSGENGVISFNIADIPSTTAVGIFDKYGICLRGGFHCAPLIHKRQGTDKHGTVRLSLSYLNSKADVEAFSRALREICFLYV